MGRKKRRIRVFENKILRRIFEPKRYENEIRQRLYNEKIHSLCRSRNRVRVVKSRRLRWAEHLVRIEGGRSAFNILA